MSHNCSFNFMKIIIEKANKMLDFIKRNCEDLGCTGCKIVKFCLEICYELGLSQQTKTQPDRLEKVQRKFGKLLCFKYFRAYFVSIYETLCKDFYFSTLEMR